MTTMGKVDDPFTTEVADGVFAYIQPDGTWFLNNTGIIVGAHTTLMVDQTSTVDRGRALMATVERVGEGRPVAGLVNTHHHGDHTFGNFLVPVGTPIYGHERARAEVLATGTAITALFQGPDWGPIEVRAPDVTFTDRLTLHIDSRTVELIHLGTPAHTTNDVVAWLPDERVCFTGDLLFNGGTPFALQGSVVGWLAALDRLADIEADVWVPGHGPVTDATTIEAVRDYLSFVLEVAGAARADGVDPLEAARSVDLGPWAELSDGERIVGNLHRAVVDLDDPQALGKPLDIASIAADMIAYNGGPIVSHA